MIPPPRELDTLPGWARAWLAQWLARPRRIFWLFDPTHLEWRPL